MPSVSRLIRSDVAYATFWLTIVVLLFFFPVIAGRQSLTDAVPTFYSHVTPDPQIKIPWQVDGGWHTIDVIPLTQFEITTIKNGVPPLWAPYSGGGESPMASNVVNIYYPLRLIFFFISDSARAFDWYFMLRFLIAGIGMFLYLRAIGLRRIVSLWGGIAYAFTGYFILYLTYSFLDIDGLLPWMLLMIEHYFRSPSLRRAGLIGFFLALFILTGQPQSTIIVALFAFLYFIWKMALDHHAKKERRTIILHFLFFILVALLIASPFICDFLVNYAQGVTVPDWDTKGLAHFPPAYFLHFFIPPAMMPEVAFSGHLFDRYYLVIPYFGISVMMLFLASIFLKKKAWSLAPLYVWIAFIALKNAGFPLIQWIGNLPILNQVGWYKGYGAMACALVICGAVAFEHILQDEHSVHWRRFYLWLLAIPAAIFATCLLVPGAFFNAYVPNFDLAHRDPQLLLKITGALAHAPSAIRGLLISALQNHSEYFTLVLFLEATALAGLTLVVLHFLQQPRHRERAAVCMVLLTAFELWLFMPKIRDGFHYFDPYAQTPPYVGFLEQRLARDGVARTFSVGDILQGHIGELYKIQKSQNNSAVKPRRYFAFLPDAVLAPDMSIVKSGAMNPIISPQKLPEVPRKFFDAFSIRYLLSEQILPPEPWLALIYDQDMKIYENKNALPHAYVVFQKETATSPEEARAMFYHSSFDPHEDVIIEDGNAIVLPSTKNIATASPATVTSYQSNEVMVHTATGRDGILVLTDTFYLGWHAYLDGVQVPIYPANVMFRGIYLPSGTHTVRFAYEPVWFWPSLILSLLTMVVIAYVVNSKKSS